MLDKQSQQALQSLQSLQSLQMQAGVAGQQSNQSQMWARQQINQGIAQAMGYEFVCHVHNEVATPIRLCQHIDCQTWWIHHT